MPAARERLAHALELEVPPHRDLQGGEVGDRVLVRAHRSGPTPSTSRDSRTGKQTEEPHERLPQGGAGHHEVDHATLAQGLRALEAGGQALLDRLLDDAWPRKADQGPGLGEVD